MKFKRDSIIIFASLFILASPAFSQITKVKRLIIPGYPELARVVGIQGIVSVDILPNGNHFVMSGPPELIKSPIFDVISDWKYSHEKVGTTRINFDFILLEPDDPSFKTSMNWYSEIILPDTIRIYAKKNKPLK